EFAKHLERRFSRRLTHWLNPLRRRRPAEAFRNWHHWRDVQQDQFLPKMIRKGDRVWQCLKRSCTEVGCKEKRSRSIRELKWGIQHRMRPYRQDQVVRFAKDPFRNRAQHKPLEAWPRMSSNHQQLDLLLPDDRLQLLPNFALPHDEFVGQIRQRSVLHKS